jgi:hypothetical protein
VEFLLLICCREIRFLHLLSGQTRRDRVPTFTHYNMSFSTTPTSTLTNCRDSLTKWCTCISTLIGTSLIFCLPLFESNKISWYCPQGTVRVPAPLICNPPRYSLVGNVLHRSNHHTTTSQSRSAFSLNQRISLYKLKINNYLERKSYM